MKSVTITDQALIALGERCPALRTLQFHDHRSQFTDLGVRALLDGCPLLGEADLFFEAHVSPALAVAYTIRGSLRSLRVRDEDSRWCDDTLAQDIVRCNRSLTSVAFPQCAWLTDETLARCGEHCGLLEKLSIENCASVTSAGLCRLLQSGKGLRELRFVGCATNDVLTEVGRRCPRLTTLVAFQGAREAITDDSVRAVLQGCPHLRETDVCYAGSLSDDLRSELARRIEAYGGELCLDSRWRNVNDSTVESLFKAPPALVSVSMSRHHQLADRALVALGRFCPQLQNLTCYSEALTDAGLEVLARGCPRLERVDVSCATEVGDAGVLALAQHCPNLSRISAAGCCGLTVEGVLAVVQGTTALTWFYIPPRLHSELKEAVYRADGSKHSELKEAVYRADGSKVSLY